MLCNPTEKPSPGLGSEGVVRQSSQVAVKEDGAFGGQRTVGPTSPVLALIDMRECISWDGWRAVKREIPSSNSY